MAGRVKEEDVARETQQQQKIAALESGGGEPPAPAGPALRVGDHFFELEYPASFGAQSRYLGGPHTRIINNTGMNAEMACSLFVPTIDGEKVGSMSVPIFSSAAVSFNWYAYPAKEFSLRQAEPESYAAGNDLLNLPGQNQYLVAQFPDPLVCERDQVLATIGVYVEFNISISAGEQIVIGPACVAFVE